MRPPWLPLASVLVLGLGGAAACSDDGPAEGQATSTAFCAELRAAVEADLTVFDPLQPASPQDTRAATARLAEVAPPEVADDMALLADTFADVTGVLDELGPSDPDTPERLAALEIDQEEIAEAQETVTGYALDVCSIDLAAINAASVTTTVPPTTVPPTTGVPGTAPPPVPEGD